METPFEFPGASGPVVTLAKIMTNQKEMFRFGLYLPPISAHKLMTVLLLYSIYTWPRAILVTLVCRRLRHHRARSAEGKKCPRPAD